MSWNINLKQEFQEYFNEQESFSLRSERFFEEYSSGQMNQQRMMQWLEAAFIRGARTISQNTIDILRQSSHNEVSGVVADNIMVHYTKVLQDEEDE